MNFTLPISRLYESETLLAFFHPQPAYPFHVLITPKEKISNFLALDTENSYFLMEVYKVAQKIIADYQLDQSGYRLIVNGGSFQDFPLLHFHLISDIEPTPIKELS
jgi:histidine triad (HIT) family protein